MRPHLGVWTGVDWCGLVWTVWTGTGDGVLAMVLACAAATEANRGVAAASKPECAAPPRHGLGGRALSRAHCESLPLALALLLLPPAAAATLVLAVSCATVSRSASAVDAVTGAAERRLLCATS